MKKNLYQATARDLERCPQCSIAKPFLSLVHSFKTESSNRRFHGKWNVYVCSSCGKPVVGGCGNEEHVLQWIFPNAEEANIALPTKALAFLQQALECLHAPSGAIMLCASSVDAMLKEKGLLEGSLYRRIEKAADDHLITREMATWAHEVRLDANDERHADHAAELPTTEDARRCLDFTKALGEFLFVLPSKIATGIASAAGGH